MPIFLKERVLRPIARHVSRLSDEVYESMPESIRSQFPSIPNMIENIINELKRMWHHLFEEIEMMIGMPLEEMKENVRQSYSNMIENLREMLRKAEHYLIKFTNLDFKDIQRYLKNVDRCFQRAMRNIYDGKEYVQSPKKFMTV